MDENRLMASLRDEIGLSIEAEMSVSPPPGLVAQVRARVDLERTSMTRWPMWQLAGAGALVVLITAVALVQWQRGVDSTLVVPAGSGVRNDIVFAVRKNALSTYPPSVRPALPSPRAVRQSSTPERPSSGQAAALAAYIAHLRRNPIVPTMEDEVTRMSIETLALPRITIKEIIVEPLPKLDAVKGER